jgi:hypothetical protein
MVSFENLVKSMPPSLSELKVTPSFCFAFKIPDHPTATNQHCRLNLAAYFFGAKFHTDVFRMKGLVVLLFIINEMFLMIAGFRFHQT